MILSVEQIWVGYEPGVEGVCVIVNKGMPTEQRFSIRMWTALNAGLELAKRGGMLISDSHAGVPKASAEEIRGMNS